ncbi:MAG: hypothetical protein LBH09_01840 [Peptococcaceae bacterium]|jgi:hypothetical protein|nr:hypothetical protein [Peptococcaceae bacterium]
MSENKSGGPLYGIGGVTLLTVLLILCLTLFSVLALSSAQADHRLSEKNATAVTSYYETENQAFEMLKEVEELWPSGNRRPSVADVSAKLAPMYGFQVQDEGEGLVISADIAVMETQTLQVEAYLGPGGSGNRWEIRIWKLLPTEQDEGDVINLPLFIPGS